MEPCLNSKDRILEMGQRAVVRSEVKPFLMQSTPNSTLSPSYPSHIHEDFRICFYESSSLFDEPLSLLGKTYALISVFSRMLA